MKSYQKIILLVVLAMSMCFSVILTASAANGEDNLTFAVEASPSAAKPGDVIAITVKATKNDGLFYGTVQLKYDAAKVEFVDCVTTDSVFVLGGKPAVEAKDNGSALLVELGTVENRNAALDKRTYANAVAMKGEGVVFVANFKLKAVENDATTIFTLETTSRSIMGSATAVGAPTNVANYAYTINGVTYVDNNSKATATGSANIVAANHSHDAYGWEVVTEAPETCAHKETKISKCKFCAEEKVEYGASLLEKVEAKANTCTEDGFTAHEVCKNCGEKVGYEVVKAAHKEEVLPAVAATCAATGLTEGKKCSVCNNILVAQNVVPALEHTLVVDAPSAPTCTEPGKTEGKHCSVCNTVVVPQSVLAALGHNEEILEAVEPTWNADGKTEGKKCSVCNTVFTPQNTIEAKGMPAWLIILIIVGVVVVVGGVVAILFLNKKKKA